MAEGQALLDAILVGRMDRGGARQAATALGILGLEQVALAGVRTQDFSARGNFEPFRRRLFGFDAFWTSHKVKFLSKQERGV